MSLSPARLRLIDVPIGVFVGIIWTILCCDWLAQFHTSVDGVFYADLIEYCNGVSTQNRLGIGASNKRSTFAMMLPRYFSQQHGVFDGLALGAIWGQVGIGAVLYWWGCLIGGKRLGFSVVMLASVAAPLTFISRVLSSYPAMSLCFVLGALGAMWGIKSKKVGPTLFAGMTLGCALLADTRGIVWVLPWSVGITGSIFLRGQWTTKLKRMVAFIIPLWISHTLAPEFYVFDALGLESQVDIRPSLYHWLKIYPPPYEYAANYTWGMAPLSDLPKTIQFLWEQTQLVVPASDRDAGLILGRSIARFYWEWAILGIIASILRYAKEPWTLIAILCSVCPFIMTFHGALTMLEEHIRFYIQTLPGVVVVWAILWNQGAELLETVCSKLQTTPFRGRTIVHWCVAFLLPLWLLLQLILGSIQTPLAPNADWRRDWDPQPSDFQDLISHYEDGSMMRDQSMRACGRNIQSLIKKKRPLHTTVYKEGTLHYFQNTFGY